MEFDAPLSSAESKMSLTDPVSTIMTRSVVVAHPFHNFSEVLELFSKHGMHHLPILDGGNKIIGIISPNDLMKVFYDPQYKNLSLNTDEADKAINIKDLMTPTVITISPNDTIKQAAKIFTDNKISSMPVVDAGQVVGIITIKDVVQLIAYFS